MSHLHLGEKPRSRVEGLRRIAAYMLERRDFRGLAIAYDHFLTEARATLNSAARAADLADWQRLALDFEVGLEDVDRDLSADARRLAAELYAAISMLERNPADQIGSRPTARKVLEALAALGGVNCSLSNVRQHSGLGQTHLSNILKPLTAHGFITADADPADARGRRLSLTSLGRAALVREEAPERPKAFQDHIHVGGQKHVGFRRPLNASSIPTSGRYTCSIRPAPRSLASQG